MCYSTAAAPRRPPSRSFPAKYHCCPHRLCPLCLGRPCRPSSVGCPYRGLSSEGPRRFRRCPRNHVSSSLHLSTMLVATTKYNFVGALRWSAAAA